MGQMGAYICMQNFSQTGQSLKISTFKGQPIILLYLELGKLFLEEIPLFLFDALCAPASAGGSNLFAFVPILPSMDLF